MKQRNVVLNGFTEALSPFEGIFISMDLGVKSVYTDTEKGFRRLFGREVVVNYKEEKTFASWVNQFKDPRVSSVKDI